MKKFNQRFKTNADANICQTVNKYYRALLSRYYRRPSLTIKSHEVAQLTESNFPSFTGREREREIAYEVPLERGSKRGRQSYDRAETW